MPNANWVNGVSVLTRQRFGYPIDAGWVSGKPGKMPVGAYDGSTIAIANNTAAVIFVLLGDNIYVTDLNLSGSGTGGFIISGNPALADLRDTGTAAHSVKFTKSTTTTVSTWTVSGNSGALITLDTVDGAGTFAINAAGATVQSSDYLNIQRSVAGGAGASWYAGAHSVNNNGAGSGWIFTSPPGTSVSASASFSASSSPSPSASISPSPSPSISLSPSGSLSASESPSISLSPSGSLSASESASISLSPSASASPSAEVVISGETCWGHLTDVTETNIRTFTDNWIGTGAIQNAGTGDAERIALDVGEYMISEVVGTGSMYVELLQNEYAAGDAVLMQYRHGPSIGDCEAAAWNDYVMKFNSLGFVQVRIESTL